MEPVASQQDIQLFRDWVKKVPYLSNDVDDHVVSAFIQGAKGRMERAKEVYDNFHMIRLKYPDLFSKIDPLDPEIIKNIKISLFCYSPVTYDGSIVTFSKVLEDSPDFCPVALMRARQLYILSALLNRDQPLKYGSDFDGRIHLIFDVGKFSIYQMSTYTPAKLKAIMENSKAIPMRMASVHFINVSATVENFVNMFKSFLKTKLADRVHVHKSAEGLLKHFPASVLASDFGGTLPSSMELAAQQDGEHIKKRQLFLDWEEKMKSMDKLRPMKQEDIIVGTFKKLQVD